MDAGLVPLRLVNKNTWSVLLLLLPLAVLYTSCNFMHDDIPSHVKHPKGKGNSSSKPFKEGKPPRRVTKLNWPDFCSTGFTLLSLTLT